MCSAHLEADVLQVGVEVVQHSATIEDEGGLQHLLVNLLIVQLLWWNSKRYEDSGSYRSQERMSEEGANQL